MSMIWVLCTIVPMRAAPKDARVADAAMQGHTATVRALLKEGADVNVAQGDGTTALHWAAVNDDLEMAQMLLDARANVKATTRNDAITPLLMASQNGNPRMIELLLQAGAEVNSPAATGITPIMLAVAGSSEDAVRVLVQHGADVNAKEDTYGQTPLMFAAAFNRPEAIKVLLLNGAKPNTGTKVRIPRARGGGPRGLASDDPKPAADPMGGMTALLYAVRQGHADAVRALLDNGADLNAGSADNSTPLMMATINGHLDLAMYLLERGADPKIASTAGGTPLYRTLDVYWAPIFHYPQPNVGQERVTYLELMKALLDRGADPNARLKAELWYTTHGLSLDALDPAGATPFWRAAQVGDLAAMRLLVANGADPSIPTTQGITPLLVLSGSGFNGDSVTAPEGRMPAIRYMVEELHADVNALDEKGGENTSIVQRSTRGYTAVHNAAMRGDNEMILYLVSKGARVDLVGKNGMTTADMANGPRERIQPFPETITLLVSLGAKNSNKCVTC
jgi:ankyrin repeat protein